MKLFLCRYIVSGYLDGEHPHSKLCDWLLWVAWRHFVSIKRLLDYSIRMWSCQLRRSHCRSWICFGFRLDHLWIYIFDVLSDWLHWHCRCVVLPIEWLLDCADIARRPATESVPAL